MSGNTFRSRPLCPLFHCSLSFHNHSFLFLFLENTRGGVKNEEVERVMVYWLMVSDLSHKMQNVVKIMLHSRMLQNADNLNLQVFAGMDAKCQNRSLGPVCSSSTCWKASYTILLITRPGLYSDGRPLPSLNNDTYVDVDPLMTDAYCLRAHLLG